MDKKYVSLCLICLFVSSVFLVAARANIAVGVKAGDWIEYKVTATGNPPEVHNVQWARMEIISVQGPEVKANVTTEDNSGVFSSLIMDMNIEKGEIGAWFIIPANLNIGQTFYDINLDRNVTIEGQQQKTYCGAVRTVVNATSSERIKDWDKATGVFVNSIDTLPGYTVNATAIKTNMWNPQILGIDQTLFYALVAVVIVVVVVAVAAVFLMRRRTQKIR